MYPYHLLLRRLIGRDGKQQRHQDLQTSAPHTLSVGTHARSGVPANIGKTKFITPFNFGCCIQCKVQSCGTEERHILDSQPCHEAYWRSGRPFGHWLRIQQHKLYVSTRSLIFQYSGSDKSAALENWTHVHMPRLRMAAGLSNWSQYYTSEITSTSYGRFWYIMLSLIPLLLMLLLMLLWFTIVLFCFVSLVMLLLACLLACLFVVYS
jgi:hypothetical protein